MPTESDLISRGSNCAKVKSIIPFKRCKSDKHEKFEELMVISTGNRKHVFDLILLSDIID